MGLIGKSIEPKRCSLFTLLALSLVFIGVFSISLSSLSRKREIDSRGISQTTLGASTENAAQNNNPPTPTFITENYPPFSARAVLAVDMGSGAILYEKNSQETVMPASTAKIISAMVSLDTYELDQSFFIPKIYVEGQKIGLKEGEIIRFEDLLYALLVSSANDAAEALAMNYPGGRNVFIANMNLKARNLGLKNSLFLNPSGLDEAGQVTTAQDMVKAAFYAIQNPVFEKIVGTKKYLIKNDDGEVVYNLTNINQLLGVVDGVNGVKTGKTDGAMENLVTYVDRDNAKVMIGMFGSSDRFGETEALIEWLYSSYMWK